MKKCFKKFGIMFITAFAIMLGTCISAFADDNAVIGIANLNNTAENSAKVGDVLTAPEIGWKRYNDTDSKIQYIGDWETLTYDGTYKNDETTTYTTRDSLKFKFYGTKFRIVTAKWFDGDANTKIVIDGVTQYYTQKGTNQLQTLLFEASDLNLKVHEVIISSNFTDNSCARNDAIDIDDTGYLVNQNNSISLNKSSLTLKEGNSEKLTATTTSSAVDIDWSSSDETVATVDSNGNVKAIKEGQATITSQIKGTDIKADCIVTVTKEDKEPEPIDPEQEYIINTAYAKGDNTNNASGEVSIIFKGAAEAQLKVLKTADVDSVYVGDNFTYTIEVTNTSDKTAKSVVINDSAPNHIQFIPNGVTTTQGLIDSSSTSKSIIVNVGDIPPSGTVIIKIPVLVVE